MDKFNLATYFESNKKVWNQRAEFTYYSDYETDERLKSGYSTLNSIRIIRGWFCSWKTILHLHCNLGWDTLSWAALGAKVVGVYFLEKCFEFAEALNQDLNLDASFICCNVYDLPNYLNQKFDIVFASYGVLPWLPNLREWMHIVNLFLKPNGFFYLVDYHLFICGF